MNDADKARYFISNISGYEKASAIVWLILGIIQVLVGLFAFPLIFVGIWNIVVSVSRFKRVDRIRALDPTIPAEYEGIVSLIILGVVNLILGAVIGIAGAVIDFYVRDQILKNRELFTPEGQKALEIKRQASNSDMAYQQLIKLGELKEKNIITEEEFSVEKTKILNTLSSV